MQKQAKNETPVWPTVRRIVGMAGNLRVWLVVAIGIDLVQAALLVLQNDFMRKFFDAVSNRQPDLFRHFVILTLSLYVASIPLSYLRTSAIGRFSERTLARIRELIASHSTRLPIGYLETRHSGDMLSVLNVDLGKVRTLLSDDVLNLIGQTARGVAAFAYILSINWILVLVSTIATPLLVVLISALSKPVSKRSGEMQEEIGQVNSLAQDSISGAMVVKTFGLTQVMEDRFAEANQTALEKGLKIARLRALSEGVGTGLSITPFIIALGLGGYMMLRGQMTFGSLFAFINLLNFVVNPLNSIPNIIASISEAAGAGHRIMDLIHQPPEREDGAPSLPIAAGDVAIRFDGASFAYDSTPVLKDISLDVNKGQTVAIVGPSGGGKSTLVKLILGYYPLERGRLQLMGRDLNDWKLTAARQQMAFVAQDTYLFPVSIGENIRLGRPEATQSEVEQAARLANIHDFVAGLPQGYDTPAGEWGSRLSGGQKQRISLARAILKDAPILVLDEPTSALDTESEALVQQALNRFTSRAGGAGTSEARTTVVIAHRLSTIKNADRVLVLQDGEIVEEGTHDELMARGGLYLNLVQQQLSQPATGDAPIGIGDAPSESAMHRSE